jgi:hypothetical protein
MVRPGGRAGSIQDASVTRCQDESLVGFHRQRDAELLVVGRCAVCVELDGQRVVDSELERHLDRDVPGQPLHARQQMFGREQVAGESRVDEHAAGGIGEDHTAQRRLQIRVRREQRLEAFDQDAAGERCGDAEQPRFGGRRCVDVFAAGRARDRDECRWCRVHCPAELDRLRRIVIEGEPEADHAFAADGAPGADYEQGA